MLPNTETLWNMFRHPLQSYISYRISDPTLADDILQEVFLKIHAHIETLGDESNIESWVYRIARNAVIDAYRKQSSAQKYFANLAAEDVNALPASDDREDMRLHQELAAGLRGMIATLPEKYADALSSVEFQGVSQIELAEKLGISVSGAKSRVQRGRRLLKDMFMRCCHFEFDRYGTIIDCYPVACCCCHARRKTR